MSRLTLFRLLGLMFVVARSADALSQTAPRPPQRYAVLLGVSSYPGTLPNLKGGPLNDVALMRDLLVNHFGFSASSILTLTDRQVTRRRVIAAIRSQLGRAEPNDIALLYYSGHGIQVDAKKGLSGADDPEPDGLDEALLLWSNRGTRATYLLDDEVGILLDGLRAKRVVAIIDACHSASATRAAIEGDVPWSELGHGQPPDLPIRASRRSTIFLPRSVPLADARLIIDAPDTLLTTGPRPPQREHLLLAAAHDDEIALGGSVRLPNGSTKPIGLFTAALYLTVREATPVNTISQIMGVVERAVSPVAFRLQGSAQTPTATGPGLSESFGAVFALPDDYGKSAKLVRAIK